MVDPSPPRDPNIVFHTPAPPARSGARPYVVAFVVLVFIALALAVWGWGYGFDGDRRTAGVSGAGRAAPQRPLGPIGAGSDTNGPDGGVSKGLGAVTGTNNTGR